MLIKKKKKLVVAYCRVSTLEQKKKGHGIDIQIRDVTLFAERHGLLVERFYKDEAVSGVKEERKGLIALMRACKNNRIETIILPSLDRLSREVRITENLFHELKKLEVQVLIADMPYYNGERKDILIRQILEAIAEENRRDIIERLFKGRQERARKGLFPGGTLPYGYTRTNKKVMVHTREAEIVSKIFEIAAKGLSGRAVAEELNNCGYRRRDGNPWTQRQVCRTLNKTSLYLAGFVHYGEAMGENNSAIIFSRNEPEKTVFCNEKPFLLID